MKCNWTKKICYRFASSSAIKNNNKIKSVLHQITTPKTKHQPTTSEQNPKIATTANKKVEADINILTKFS